MLKKSYFAFLLVFVLSFLNLRGQSFGDKLFYSIQPEYSTLVAHHQELKALSLYDFPSLSLALYSQTTGDEEWEKRWNYPQGGVSLNYNGLSNKKVYGEAFSIMPFQSFTFFRKPKCEHRFMIAAGLGYLTHPYDSITNPENIAIGSHLNFSAKFQYSFLYRFTPNFGVSLGTSFGHFSNGATKYPNWGINVWSISVATHLKMNRAKIEYKDPLIEPFSKKWAPYIWAAIGAKKNNETDPALYKATSFGVGYIDNYKFGKEWIMGLDIFWDYTDKIEYRNIQEFPNTMQLFKVGIVGGHEWSMNRIAVAFQSGVYLYQYSYISPRNTDFIYSRIALKYKLCKGLQANVSIKSHFARADYIEWGLIYKFNMQN